MRLTRAATIAALFAALHCAYPGSVVTHALAADTTANASKDGWYSPLPSTQLIQHSLLR